MNVPDLHERACAFVSCWVLCSICLQQIKLVQIFYILIDFLSTERGMLKRSTLMAYLSNFLCSSINFYSVYFIMMLGRAYESESTKASSELYFLSLYL